jgi:kumamolisin
MGDIEVAGSVAPGARIVVYFANNTEANFLNAIKTATNDNKNKTTVICINWGASEKNWTASALTNFNKAFKDASDVGVTVCVASGDGGSSDGVTDGSLHVDFPASSPYVLACGGSKLIFKGEKVSLEKVWNASQQSATGGGVSAVFPMPGYQKGVENVLGKLAFKGRALPDISANADPAVGYKVYVDGQSLVIGGTSMSTPLIAGLIALINQGAGYNVGFINPLLYSKIGPSGAFHDITVGDNITTSTKLGYKALPGWDAATGWGSPNGKNLLEFFKSQKTKK